MPWPAYRALRDALPCLAAATVRPGVVPSVILRFHRALLVGGGELNALVHDVLEPLRGLSPREATELFGILDALCGTGGSAASLARHLHRHKNTVAKRLRRAQDVVGLDLRRPAERLVLETAVRMRRVAAALDQP